MDFCRGTEDVVLNCTSFGWDGGLGWENVGFFGELGHAAWL